MIFACRAAGILDRRRRRFAHRVERVVDRLARSVGDRGHALRIVVVVIYRAGIRQRDQVRLA